MENNSGRLFEACVETVEQAVAAEKGGARRIELCTDLKIGGVTPNSETIIQTRRRLHIPIHLLVRPRGGDFCYSDSEFEEIKRDILAAKETGIEGVVIGVLKRDGAVDSARTRELVELARPMNVTFHRAFDETPDPIEALEAIIDVGCDRLLTSGHKPSAEEGAGLIGELISKRGRSISIMPGGGVNERNALRILRETGAAEIHGSLGGSRYTTEEYAERVRSFVRLIND